MNILSEIKTLLSEDDIYSRNLYGGCVYMTDTDRLQKLRSINFRRNDMIAEVKTLLSEDDIYSRNLYGGCVYMTDTERLQKLRLYRSHIIRIIHQ